MVAECRCRLNRHSGIVFTWVFNICAACGVIIFQNACRGALLQRGPVAVHARALTGTCGVGALEAKLPAALRGGASVRTDFYNW